MSSELVRVNFTSVELAADTIEEIAKKIEGQLAELRSYCDLATSQWTGNARDAYQVLQQDWDSTAGDLNHNLQQIALTVRTSHQNFTDAENRATQMWTV